MFSKQKNFFILLLGLLLALAISTDFVVEDDLIPPFASVSDIVEDDVIPTFASAGDIVDDDVIPTFA